MTRLVKDGPLSEGDLRRLHSFGWDSDEILVVMTRADACQMLNRPVRGEVPADDLVEWANQIEAREDIGFEDSSATTLDDLIYELANPTLHHDPTSEAARRWLDALT
jgi:hypothetical protein